VKASGERSAAADVNFGAIITGDNGTVISHSPRNRILLSSAVVSTVALAIIAIFISVPRIEQKYFSSRPAVIPPTTTRPTLSTAIPTQVSSASPTTSYGTALKFKIQSANSPMGPGDVAFPDSGQAQIRSFDALFGPSNTPVPEGIFPGGMADENRNGGYSLGGLVIALHVENTSSRPLSISGIRVIKIHTLPIATGAVFYLPSGSGDMTSLFMELDYPNPIPRATTPSTDFESETPPTEKPFFNIKGLPIGANSSSDYLDITFAAQRAAYDFTVAFDYTFQGDDRKYTQILANGDQPWRVTGWACRRRNSSDKSYYKPNLRYKFVRVSEYTTAYTTKMSTPDHGCDRWG
jgi:hypothetical protein